MSEPTKQPATCLEALGSLAFLASFPLAQALGSIFDAWIAVKLWAWFVASYTTIPAPPLAVFIGIDYLASILFKKRTRDDGDLGWREIITKLLTGLLVYPTMLLATAYLIHRWIS